MYKKFMLFSSLFLFANCQSFAETNEKYPFTLNKTDGEKMDSVVCKTEKDYLKFSDLSYNSKDISQFLKSGKCFHIRSKWLSSVKNPKNINKEAGEYEIKTPDHGVIYAYGAPVIDD